MCLKTVSWFAAISIISVSAQSQLTVNDKLLRTIDQYMDTSIDPCDDFFSYACGKWSKHNKNGRYTESIGLVDHKINKRLVHLLQSYDYGQNNLTDKVWTFYKSCRHERKRRPIRYLQIVKPDDGLDWPIFHEYGEWNEDNKFDWLRTVAHLHRYGLRDAIFDHVVLQNGSDSSKYLISLDMEHTTETSYFQSTMIDTITSLGYAEHMTLNWVLRLKYFEEALLELQQVEDEYGLVEPTLQNFAEDMPHSSWKDYFEIILGHEVPENYSLEMQNYQYFMALDELLKNTDPELLCSYLMYKFVMYLNFDSSASSDKIDCLVDVRSKMDLAMNYIYAQTFFKKEAEIYNEDVRQIIDVIRADFNEKLEENRMNLSGEEIEFLRKKLNKMGVNVGNLPNHIDHEFVSQYYSNIRLDRKNYYRNHLALLKFRFIKEHEQLLKGRQEPDDFFYIADSDTARSSTLLYVIRQNLIVVPNGFLQTPIYHHNMHDVLKYSLLGFNLAHEISHGFDSSGVCYDYDGVYSKIGENITESINFMETLSCMQRKETPYLDERIADIVGLRLAFDAFFKSNRSLEDQKNRSFNGKPIKEIFFLNFAQFFCGNMDSEFVDHDSDKVRLKESLSNFEPFAETYQCKVGTSMNPKQKCRLW